MPKSEKKDLVDSFASSRLSIFLQATFTTLAIMAILGGGSYLLDKKLGTFPTLFIIGLAVGYPLTQFYIYKKFKKYSK